MKIAIDIPEEEYRNYLKMRPAYPEGVFCYIAAIQQGTPLPEGKLVSVEGLKEDIEAAYRQGDIMDYHSVLSVIDNSLAVINPDSPDQSLGFDI